MSETASAEIRVRIDERDGGARVARVTVDNSRKLNTLNRALMDRFIATVEQVARDDAVRVIVLDGAGERAFVGGADIDEMAALEPASARAFITQLHRCCDAVREAPMPVIARLHGYTLGAGLELAAACDLRVAAESARVGMPEVKVGIPSVIEAALLPTLVGWGRARAMLMLGETFSATEAAGWGLIERVVPDAALDAAVEDWVGAFVALPPLAVRRQKRLMRAWEDLPLGKAIATGIDAFAASFETDEPRRAMGAFLARRPKRG